MTDIILLSDDIWEDALNMSGEYMECSCGKAAQWDCATCLLDLCDFCAESHILGRHEVGRM